MDIIRCFWKRRTGINPWNLYHIFFIFEVSAPDYVTRLWIFEKPLKALGGEHPMYILMNCSWVLLASRRHIVFLMAFTPTGVNRRSHTMTFINSCDSFSTQLYKLNGFKQLKVTVNYDFLSEYHIYSTHSWYIWYPNCSGSHYGNSRTFLWAKET